MPKTQAMEEQGKGGWTEQPSTESSPQDEFMGKINTCLCLGPGSSQWWEVQGPICLPSEGWQLYAQTTSRAVTESPLPTARGLRQIGRCLDEDQCLDSAHTSAPLPLGPGTVQGLERKKPTWGSQGHRSGMILGKDIQSSCSLGLTSQALPLGSGR